MSKDLTVSTIDRQNILNNRYALEKLEEHLALGGLLWRGEAVFTKPQVAELLDVDERTIDRYISSHGDELGKNGYVVLQGNNLKDFKELISDNDMNVVIKTVRLGVFSFRAVLNLSMLLTESERARFIRSRILDVVIDVMAERAGGHTKYINQRDADYLPAAFQEESYRKKFTSALGNYVENFPYKYPNFTDRIYQSIFHEKAHEYRKILKLHAKENVRDTMYTEILELISSYENGLAHAIEQKYNALGRKLNYQELKEVFDTFESNPAFEPLVQAARTKMATQYVNTPLMPAFNSLDMIEIIERHQPDLWVYGHTHECDDQRIGKTRIISNQLGYPHRTGFECAGFDPAGKPVDLQLKESEK